MYAEPMAKIGEGVPVGHLRLGPIKDALYDGSFEPDPVASHAVAEAHASAGDYSRDELQALLREPACKGFRNAYTSITIERAWDPYLDATANGRLQTIGFGADGRSHLSEIDTELLGALSADEIAQLIEESNEAAILHYICEQFYGDSVPAISGDPDKDRRYHQEFKRQTDLDVLVTSNPSSIPDYVGSDSVFVTSGTLLFRTHIFGMPVTIDKVMARDSLRLDNDQHRSCLVNTLRSVVRPHYLATTVVAGAAIMPLIDHKTRELDASMWVAGEAAESPAVYPVPEFIRAANEKLRQRTNLPAATHCPAFSARVRRPGHPEETVQFAHGAQEHAMNQFDALYYPRRAAA